MTTTSNQSHFPQRIFVAGHRGMVGSAIVRALGRGGDNEVITRGREDLDLLNQAQVMDFFKTEKIDQVYLAAAKVGGILANNTFPADFIYQNLMIQANVVHASWATGVPKLLLLGSSCIYPKLAPQPMQESALLAGGLEPTNEPYAVAKIAGIKLCESYNRQYGTDYRSVMPTNLYGPGDNYHPENSHVIPALLRRFHQATLDNAPIVSVWGSGNQLREFLYVEDMAEASVFVMNLTQAIYQSQTLPMLGHINVGYGEDISIRQLVELIAKVVGYRNEITFDTQFPDGAPRKLMDSSLLLKLGWSPKVSLAQGLALTYSAFKSEVF